MFLYRSIGRLFLLLTAALPASAQASHPGDAFIGADHCAPCHQSEFEKQSRSQHAHALSRPGDHALAADFTPAADFVRSAKYRFHFFRAERDLRVRAWDAVDQIEIPLDWAFGAGQQAVTFVSRIDSNWYLENALSYYSAAHSYATTPGHEDTAHGPLKDAVGRMYRTNDPASGITGCFECHSTGPVATGLSGSIEPHENGVRCEACHGQGAAHNDSALANNTKDAIAKIRNPGHLSAEELNVFCGKCHRSPGPEGVQTDWSVAWNVRHEPIYFGQSACFRASKGAFSCLTCHDPHSALLPDDTAYNSRCRQCHSEQARKPALACGDIAAANCVECHMPKVSPQPWLRFTNHWIGVYSAGSKLRPIR